MTSQKTGASKDVPVVVVVLRQPRMDRPDERRSDPFWEFGSFGVTGCHTRNLMHPGKSALLEGVRFAFAQGGDGGFRLVYLTPPLAVVRHREVVEVRWQPTGMPFRYWDAPVIIDRDGRSDIAGVPEFLKSVKRDGWVGRFASKFRSRREPLPVQLAAALTTAFEHATSGARNRIARTYEEALPYNPPKIDHSRRQTYDALLRDAR